MKHCLKGASFSSEEELLIKTKMIVRDFIANLDGDISELDQKIGLHCYI
jgi:hypothetical protein